MGYGLRTKLCLIFQLSWLSSTCHLGGLQICIGHVTSGQVNRTLLLYSGCSAMGKLKHTIFIGQVHNSKFIVVHRSKEVHLEGGKEPVTAAFPQFSKWDGQKCSRRLSAGSALCVKENTQVEESLTQAETV